MRKLVQCGERHKVIKMKVKNTFPPIINGDSKDPKAQSNGKMYKSIYRIIFLKGERMKNKSIQT